ncbi:MAG: hypothetical protein ACW99A_03660 [Candidatus Kariarchaeaceae archaeon]|jgi:hypothetical protein
MTKPETRGYLVGLNEKGQFIVPKRLMEKIVESTGDTALMIWLPYKNTLHIQSVDVPKVIKFTILFDAITHTIFENKLNPLIDKNSDTLIYKTGVLFPDSVNERTTIELYFKDSNEQKVKLQNLKMQVEEIEGISTVDILHLEKYIGDN